MIALQSAFNQFSAHMFKAVSWSAQATWSEVVDVIRRPLHPLIDAEVIGFEESPKTKFGYVDFATILNEKRKAGIDPAENVAVDILRIYGPGQIFYHQWERDAYYRELGIAPLEERGTFITSFRFQRRRLDELGLDDPETDRVEDELFDQFLFAEENSWKADRFPEVARWIEENNTSLSEIKRATQKLHFFEPLVSQSNRVQLSYPILRVFGSTRAFQRAFRTRVGYFQGRNETDRALEDLLTVRVLNYKSSLQRVPSVIDVLVYSAADMWNFELDARLIRSGKISARAAKQQIARYEKLPPIPTLESTSLAWRYERYSEISWCALEGPRNVAELYEQVEWTLEQFFRLMAGKPLDETNVEQQVLAPCFWAPNWLIDWKSIILRFAKLHDEMERILSLEPYVECHQAALEFDTARSKVTLRAENWQELYELVKQGESPCQVVTEDFGRYLEARFVPIAPILRSCTEAKVRRQVVILGYALVAFRQDRGQYPESLLQLVPHYVSTVLPDPFANAPLRYKREDDRALLYSIGRNQLDDGGRFDRNADPPVDDISIVLPSL